MVAPSSLETSGEYYHISYKFGGYPAAEALVLTAGDTSNELKRDQYG